MPRSQANLRRFAQTWKAVFEMALLVFFFYSVRLMAEFTVSNGQGKSLLAAIKDILTGSNLLIALAAALVGHFVIEYIRSKL